jgi:DNA-binding transcriptional regulator LsrR (DeoR family)
MGKALSYKQIEWAYDKWCIGYTQSQIAEALHVCEKTITRALNNKPRIRPVLKYDKEEER